MKGILSLFLTLLFLISAVGCTSSDEKTSKKVTDDEKGHTENVKHESKGSNGQKVWKLTVMHTNDTHGHIETVPRRFTVIKKIRKDNKNTVLLSAGDVFMGTLYFTKYHGKAAVNFMNKLGYDAEVPGNHEFDSGTKQFSEFVKKASFPIVSSNIDYSKDLNFHGLLNNSIVKQSKGYGGNIYPAVILNVNGKKVGVFGLTTEETTEVAAPGDDVKFKNHTKVAKNMVKRLKDKGVNKIIAVTHLGVEVDKRLAESVSGIDIIVGGHSHTKLSKAIVVRHNDTPTLIVQASSYGEYLGKLDATFNKSGQIVKWNDKLIAINKKNKNGDFVIKADKGTKAKLDKYTAKLGDYRKKLIGKTLVRLNADRDTKQNVRNSETNLGDLCADSMLWELKRVTNATIALQNGGNIRASINKGDITLGDDLKVNPFGNMIVAIDLTGQQVIDVLEHGVSAVEKEEGRFLQVAGLRYTFDSRKPVGKRILKVEVKKGKSYKPINPKATYTVVTNNYIVEGGDGFKVFKEAEKNGKLKGYKFVDYKVFEDYVKKMSPIKEKKQGRITNVATVHKAS